MNHLLIYESYTSGLDYSIRSQYIKDLEKLVIYPELYRRSRTLWQQVVNEGDDLEDLPVSVRGMATHIRRQVWGTNQANFMQFVAHIAGLADYRPEWEEIDLKSETIEEYMRLFDQDYLTAFKMKALYDNRLPVEWITLRA